MIDVCIPYGPRPDLDAPFNKAWRSWIQQGAVPDQDLFHEGIWTPDRLFSQSASRNAAAKRGKNPWILFADADMVPSPDALEFLRTLTVPENENFIFNLVGWRTPDPLWPNRGEDDPITPDIVHFYITDDPAKWRALYSEARVWYGNQVYGPVFLPRAAFEALGGYCEEFSGWGGEDDDFLIRLQKVGYRLRSSDKPYFIQCPHVSTRLLDPPGTRDHNNALLNRLTGAKVERGEDGVMRVIYPK